MRGDSPTTPKRSTRLVKPSAKAKETRIEEATAKHARGPTLRATRASSTETDAEPLIAKKTPIPETGKALLLRVLDELKDIKNASKDQQELIRELQVQIADTQRELRETKEELKHAREQLEAISEATTDRTSPRASYAEVARTPPGSQPSNIQTLSTSNTTPSKQTDNLYCTVETQKLRIKREIQSALSKVHFTVDLWTSPNALAVLGIVAHYTSESGHLEYSVLALRELDGKHSGPNMADSVMEIINDYGIASKVGYFMMDNADNNGTMMKALSTRTYVI